MEIHEKIAALLAKAQSTTFEAEADAFTRKAQALMIKHAIDLAEIEGRTGIREEEIASVDVEIPNVVGSADRDMMLQGIARVFGCRAYTSMPGMRLVGYPTDMLNAFSLWASLCIQLDAFYLYARDNGEHFDEYGRKIHHRTFKADFTRGFRMRVVARVKERYETQVKETAGASTALVLRDRKQAVNDWLAENTNLNTYSLAKRKGHGVNSGKNAANKANISNGSGQIGSQGRLLNHG